MNVIVVAGTKGGVGKSTLCCALSVCAAEEGGSVALVDVDPQGSTRDWHGLRGRSGAPELIEAETAAQAVRTAGARGIEWVFIDTPPAVIDLIEQAVSEADLVVVPVRPSPVDLLGVTPMVGLCGDYDRPFVFVLNQVPVGTALGEQAAVHLRKLGPVLKASIGLRTSVSSAMATGQTGAERGNEMKIVRSEIEQVWREIKQHVTSAIKR